MAAGWEALRCLMGVVGSDVRVSERCVGDAVVEIVKRDVGIGVGCVGCLFGVYMHQ
jgi:hypothetical protein